MLKRHLIGFFILASLIAGCSVFSSPSPTPIVITATLEILATHTPIPTVAPSVTPTLILAQAVATHLQPTPVSMPIVASAVPVQAFAGCVVQACVKQDAEGLRLRGGPSLDADVITRLNAGAALQLQGRNEDSNWLYVLTAENQVGWVDADYIETSTALTLLPLALAAVPTSIPASPYVSGITDATRAIYARGQALGSRANVFSKVGDSLTVATWVMYPLGWGQQQLGSYTQFQDVIAYFSSAVARDGNSFANISMAADNGWTTENVLNVNGANPAICQTVESPLDCELRIVRPAVVVILLGTNDVTSLSADQYRTNMQHIVEVSIARGVIPVLTTLPRRLGFEGQTDALNDILREISQQYGAPLIDYAAAMRDVPNGGLSEDGVHPSWPPGDGNWASAADFRGPNLQYGYTLRNLTILYGLDVIWRQVITPQ